MKASTSLAVAALMLATGSASAQSGDMKGMDMKGMDTKSMPMDKKGQGTPYKTQGTVKSVEPAKGTVTFAHDPVKELNWPAMTMTFKVEDKALFKKLAADKKVEFDFVKRGSDYIVTGVK
jgi:Cu(I)/Ag(I) efflux system protein CusF